MGRTKEIKNVTLDKNVVKAINHLVEKGSYKNFSHATEQLCIDGLNNKVFDNMLDKLMQAIRR